MSNCVILLHSEKLALEACLRLDRSPPLSGGTGPVPKIRTARKDNRDMEAILSLLGPAFGVDVSYKTIERLYSDEEVKMVLHNLFLLLLDEEDVSGDCFGDGTGYSLQAGRN